MRVPRVAWVAAGLFGLVALGLMVTQVVLLDRQLESVREAGRLIGDQRAISARQERRSRPVIVNARPLIAQARAAAPVAARLGRRTGALLGELTPLAADLRAAGAAEVLRGVSLLVDAVLRTDLPARASRATEDVGRVRADVSDVRRDVGDLRADVSDIRRLQRDAVDMIRAMLTLQRDVAREDLRPMLRLQREVVAHQRQLVGLQQAVLAIQRQTLALARSSLAVQQSTETHTASLDAKTGGPITPPAPVTPPTQSAGG